MAVIMMVMVQWCGGVNDKCSIGGDGGRGDYRFQYRSVTE